MGDRVVHDGAAGVGDEAGDLHVDVHAGHARVVGGRADAVQPIGVGQGSACRGIGDVLEVGSGWRRDGGGPWARCAPLGLRPLSGRPGEKVFGAGWLRLVQNGCRWDATTASRRVGVPPAEPGPGLRPRRKPGGSSVGRPGLVFRGSPRAWCARRAASASSLAAKVRLPECSHLSRPGLVTARHMATDRRNCFRYAVRNREAVMDALRQASKPRQNHGAPPTRLTHSDPRDPGSSAVSTTRRPAQHPQPTGAVRP